MRADYLTFANGQIAGQDAAFISQMHERRAGDQARANAAAWQRRCEELEQQLQDRIMELTVARVKNAVHYEAVDQLAKDKEAAHNVCRAEIDKRLAKDGLMIDRANGGRILRIRR